MSKRKERKDKTNPKQRMSPTHTVAHLSDDFIEEMRIPRLPEQIPERLADALRKRVQAFLFRLKAAKKEQYVPALEIRLVRDAHRAVLAAYELGLPEGEVFYAGFRRLVEDLDYERTDVGYTKIRDPKRGGR